jgi:hypothetical protein
MSGIEQRYRLVLRMLPLSYRQRWEEDMVAAFLESVQPADPDEAEFIADYGRPSWSEVASVAVLAVRLRLGNPGAPPRHLAWAHAFRLAALAWLLNNAASATIGLGWHLWLFNKLPWTSVQVDDLILHVRADRWHTVLLLTGLLWVPAYLALVTANLRVARLLVPLALAGNALGAAVHAARGWPTTPVLVVNLLIEAAVLVLALVAFHRGGPPIPPRPWLLALPVAIALNAALLWLQGPVRGGGWWWLDWPGLNCLVIVCVAVVHLAVGRLRRSPSWSHALALLACAALAIRIVSVLDYLTATRDERASTLVAAGLLQAGATVAVGAALAVLAAQALRHLPPEPAGLAAWSTRPDRSLPW